jgi:hypothetical protein
MQNVDTPHVARRAARTEIQRCFGCVHAILKNHLIEQILSLAKVCSRATKTTTHTVSSWHSYHAGIFQERRDIQMTLIRAAAIVAAGLTLAAGPATAGAAGPAGQQWVEPGSNIVQIQYEGDDVPGAIIGGVISGLVGGALGGGCYYNDCGDDGGGYYGGGYGGGFRRGGWHGGHGGGHGGFHGGEHGGFHGGGHGGFHGGGHGGGRR